MGCEGAKLVLGLEGGSVRVERCLDREYCASVFRGSKRGVEVDALEAAYLTATCRASLGGESGWGAALNLVARFNIPVGVFLVYYDLKNRGRRVERGARGNTLLMWRRPGAKPYEILVLEEGVNVRLSDIASWSSAASKDNHEPVIAIVDRHGVITYYEARLVSTIK